MPSRPVQGNEDREPLLITYTNILHEHGVDSDESKAFRARHKNKKVFLRRADTLDKLMKLKNSRGGQD